MADESDTPREELQLAYINHVLHKAKLFNMTTDIKAEGIILQNLKYGDYDLILTVFTYEYGLIKLFDKGALRNQKKGISRGPFTQAELIYSKQRNDLFFLQEISPFDHHFELRKDLARLETACNLSKRILETQFPLKPAPQLYRLLSSYLKRLELSAHPSTLSSSFHLKLLRHEGLLGLTPYCNQCRVDLHDYFVSGGQSFCPAHQPEGALSFSLFEAKDLFTLAFSRSYEAMEQISFSTDLEAKIEHLFQEAYNAI